MTFIDIVLAIPLGWFAFKGFTKGFVSEVSMLAALILGTYMAINFSELIGGKVGISGNNASLISFFVVFIGVVLLVYWVGNQTESLVKSMQLGIFNNLLGLIFGVLKIGVIISMCMFFLNQIDTKHVLINDEKRNKALLFRPVEKIVPVLFTRLENTQKKIEKQKEEKP